MHQAVARRTATSAIFVSSCLIGALAARTCLSQLGAAHEWDAGTMALTVSRLPGGVEQGKGVDGSGVAEDRLNTSLNASASDNDLPGMHLLQLSTLSPCLYRLCTSTNFPIHH